jgi:hypothetical protein
MSNSDIAKALKKVATLVAKHKKDIAPLINKDDPAIARPGVIGGTKNATAMSQRKFKVVDESDNVPHETYDNDDNESDESKAGRAKAKKKKDGDITIDPTEAELGNPEVGDQAAESITAQYTAYIKNL